MAVNSLHQHCSSCCFLQVPFCRSHHSFKYPTCPWSLLYIERPFQYNLNEMLLYHRVAQHSLDCFCSRFESLSIVRNKLLMESLSSSEPLKALDEGFSCHVLRSRCTALTTQQLHKQIHTLPFSCLLVVFTKLIVAQQSQLQYV